MKPKLIVTIDTEEEGLWSGRFSGYDNSVDNLTGVPAFQAICDSFSVKPTYLVNTPVLDDVDACRILESISARDACEIGCHIHPWNTPPVEDGASAERSYLCNLPIELQREKLTTVTEQIGQRFGSRPTSFRAGRYGLDSAGAQILRELNYVVDSSVCPYMDYSEDGGPDFRGAPWMPYYVGENLQEGSSSVTDLLEVPVSFGFNWSNFDLAHQIDEILSHPPFSKFRMKGILDRLSVLQKIKFSPEKSTIRQLISLVSAYDKQNAPCIVLMFHSSSLAPGNTPYVVNDRDLCEFLKKIEDLFIYCVRKQSMETATLSEFADAHKLSAN